MDDGLRHRRRGHRRQCLRAKHAGTVLARRTGLIPKMALLAMLTAPLGVQGSVATLAEPDTASPRRLDSDRSILLEVNHRPESRMREIRLSGSEGGGTELNRFSLPLSGFHQSGHMSRIHYGFLANSVLSTDDAVKAMR